MSSVLASLGDPLPLLLMAANPLHHVLDGRLAFDTHGTLEAIGLTKQVFMFFLCGLFTILFFWSYSRKAGKESVPGRWGNFVEFVLEFVRDQMTRPFMGPSGDRFVPVIATFLVFISFTNVLGLVPFFDFVGEGGNTATGNLGITGGLAVCSFAIYNIIGIREQGFFVYTKNLFPHVPKPILLIIVPVELLAHIVRPCALAVRLFANMLAGHTLVAAILGFTVVFTKSFLVGGGAISIVSMLSITALSFLELLVALIQAFVFAFLTTAYIAGAVHPEH